VEAVEGRKRIADDAAPPMLAPIDHRPHRRSRWVQVIGGKLPQPIAERPADLYRRQAR
jgi:hypothetical protein